jgi:hypothetical protein
LNRASIIVYGGLGGGVVHSPPSTPKPTDRLITNEKKFIGPAKNPLHSTINLSFYIYRTEEPIKYRNFNHMPKEIII